MPSFPKFTRVAIAALSCLSTYAVANVDPQIEAAVKAVYPALVRIHVVAEEGGAGRMQKGRASGSGTIISPDGYILTNHQNLPTD